MTVKEKAIGWLNAKNIDPASCRIIQAMLDGNPAELEECFYKDLEFGTGGLRGIMGVGTNRVNEYTIGMATQGFANYLGRQIGEDLKVVIAYDSRNNSKLFAKVTANVFAANGIKTYLFEDLRPTPELSFAIRYLGCNAGVMITASHNPKEYNGYKAYWDDGAQIIAPHDKNIVVEVQKITSIDEIKFDAHAEFIEQIGAEVDEAYLHVLQSQSLSPDTISNQGDLKIVFSSIHGTGVTMVPKVLERLGFSNVTVLEAQAKPDGNFPTVVYPNPEEAEAMTLALERAKEVNADLVMATDPDADRVGIVLKNTRDEFKLLNGNQIAALLIHYLLVKWSERGLKGNEFICKTIVTTELLKKIADDYHVPCYDTLTGFKYIAAKIKELEGKQVFIGGGEESYGYLIGDQVRDKDAVASCAIIAEMATWAKEQGKSLFEILIDINTKYGLYHEGLESLTKKGKQGAEEIQNMMDNFRSNPPQTLGGSKVSKCIDYASSIISMSDGTKQIIDLPKSNVLQFYTEEESKITMRPSGTEPKIKFYVAVKSEIKNGDYYSTLELAQNKIQNLLKEFNL